LAAVMGSLLPRERVGSRRLYLAQSPQTDFDVLNDPLRYPEWRSLLTSVEALPDHEGKSIGPVTYNDGNRFQMVFDEVASPTRVALTEHGEIPNPLIRLTARMMLNPTVCINLPLNSLAGKFSEKATPE
jgi:hypothetical protein